MSDNGQAKVHYFSFAVADHNTRLVQFLKQEKARGRGNLSKVIRDACEAYMDDERPPKWFKKWVAQVPMVTQEIEEEIKVDLDGLFERD